MIPKSLQEFVCIIGRLIDRGDFDPVGSREDVRAALQEVARAIALASFDGSTPPATVRLFGALFVRAVEQAEPLCDRFVTLENES